MTNTKNTPIEAIERSIPVRVRAYRLRSGSGGDGFPRGGEGLWREVEFLEPTTVSRICERHHSQPYGLQGGAPGAGGESWLLSDGDERGARRLPDKCTFEATPGDVLRMLTPGGGGWGPPASEPPETLAISVEGGMHPIERLRSLARLRSEQVDLLAREAAAALLGCGNAPELVVACRRLLDRHPAAGPLWWVTSSALTAPDPGPALLAAIDELDGDPTSALAEAEAAIRPHALAVPAWAVSAAGVLASAADVAEVEAIGDDNPVVLGVGVGRALPPPVWEAALARLERLPRPGAAGFGWDHVDAVVGTNGVTTRAAVLATHCPVAAELLPVSRS